MTASALLISNHFGTTTSMMEQQRPTQHEMNTYDDILNDVGLFVEEDMLLLDPQYVTSKSPPNTNTSTEISNNGGFVPVTPDHTATVVSTAAITNNVPPLPVSTNNAAMNINQSGHFKIPNPLPHVVNTQRLGEPQRESTKSKEQNSIYRPKTIRKNQVGTVTTSALKTKPRKRQLSTASATDSLNNKDASEKQMVERRERNREHAKRSRLRKKSLTHTLQQSVQELKDENERLRNQIYNMLGKDKTDVLVKERTATPTEKFIIALKKPDNRRMDNSALEFLQSLRNNVSQTATRNESVCQ